ncbi:hypothetical protein VFPPC_18216 [Pochonia chlamydosporia 170]|uniref:Uncharacterized protein n=1 Tax=Pochonia chlamydosporia 170 TaxID=1380566 RepID=A0A219AQM9_METCM|nr:hypothetical protein VFPPC_18216 [Pochonia chlamydosporia 170]OWT42604.1 hypothetical protein VFPPC_18216 [Pochonia chlamydosporia 170]
MSARSRYKSRIRGAIGQENEFVFINGNFVVDIDDNPCEMSNSLISYTVNESSFVFRVRYSLTSGRLSLSFHSPANAATAKWR